MAANRGPRRSVGWTFPATPQIPNASPRGPPKLVAQITPRVTAPTAEAAASLSDHVARFASALRGKKEGDSGADRDADRNAGGKDGDGLAVAAEPGLFSQRHEGANRAPPGRFR